MKKKLKLLYIINLFCFAWASAQQTNTVESEKNTYKQRYGLRVGADLSKPIIALLDKKYWGVELMSDYRINYSFYAAAEIGSEKKTTQTDFFSFTTNGQFLKMGVDYNTYGNWYGMENMIFVGGRYAFSRFSQQLDSYHIYKNHQYWQENTQGTNTEWLGEYNGRTAHWLEFIIGMKVELLQNLYAGTSIRLGFRLGHTQKGGFPNYWIPGFNRVWEGSRFGMNFNYGITYLVPFYKKEKSKSKEQKAQK
ncbi:conserved exported hypothetical protein [Capnocytophaga canimorsus]|uniref:Secreted protein n=1 Tax=Capnocytophaga canimorsus TaxID=28188 RepID=A0A0B7ILX1_9FLAO|nr:DUF6048 family protein [Capnocytophaga canimorsus]CEN52901.1 conserved exported hypothetical protein [Capnocytophaga canimorsus]